MTSVVCRSRSTWTLPCGAPLGLAHYTRSSSHMGGGAPSARFCAWALPVSARRSFFGLVTTVVCTFLRALPIHSVSALNLLNPKKQVTAEAPYAGGLIQEVLSVVTHC